MTDTASTRKSHAAEKSSPQAKRNGHGGFALGTGHTNPSVSAFQASGFLSAIQPKLTINQPDDIYEQEADHVAEQVMRMPAPRPPIPPNGSSPNLQRKCTACASGQGTCPECAEEEKMVQRKPLFLQNTPSLQRQVTEAPEEEEELLQTKEAPATATATASAGLESHVNGMRGGGQPLPESAHAFFAPRFGYDFSGVRLHTDSRAAESARAVNALAYTVGRDVVFGAGQYSPGTTAGKSLLAHELTHVMQQNESKRTEAQNNKAGILTRHNALQALSHAPVPSIQRTPRTSDPGLREATISVSWTDYDTDFYHRIINAIARSREFRGVPTSSLWVPFYNPIFRFHRSFNMPTTPLKPGAVLKLRVTAWFDPTASSPVKVSQASVETEQAAQLRETKIEGVLIPRTKVPGRSASEVGPGEVIDLSFKTDPAATAASLGGLKWFFVQPYVKSGRGTVAGGDDGLGTFDAEFPGRVRLELRVASGYSAGKIVSSHDLTITLTGMITNDPSKPERFTVTQPGLTPEMLAEHLYGDKSKATAIWGVWDEKARGEPWVATTKLPVGMWVRIEYRHLKTELKKIYDASLDITSRKEWGARPPILGDPKRSYEPYTGPLEDILDSIAVHHAGNKGYKTMNEVQDLHLKEKEAADIGYHFGIALSGKVYEGRPIDVKGAHVEGANTGKIGIVLLADLDPEDEGLSWYESDPDEDPLSSEMENSLLKLIHSLTGKYPKIKYLGGHKEYNPRNCPGKKVMDKMSSWRTETNLLKPP